ncbi:MAG: RluA family pseudouridine synthase [Gammaproteobacteria bacterium]|nr:RluA family pseudouridine synthase [Gammaproteobacteria bacterium]
MSESEQGQHHSARIVEVDGEDDGMRIDNYLLRVLKGVPRSRIYRLLRRGEVRVNSGRIRPSHRLQRGDQVRIPPIRLESREQPAGVTPQRRERLERAILFEDPRLLVIDKPAGIAVHGGSGIDLGLIEALRLMRPGRTLELVHRLDRDTSGCLMVAKRRSELRALHALLRDGAVDKRYLALLEGQFREDKWICDAPLALGRRGGERYAFVDADGKQARSEFRRMQLFRDATLVEVILHTGRTHQIRAHAAHLGHPVAGDDRYGRGNDFGAGRLCLHAHALRFERPHDGEDMHFHAPLPAALRDAMQRLR